MSVGSSRLTSHARSNLGRARANRTNAVDLLGRVGFTARGIVYLLIGWITLMIAVDHRTMEADRTGALELVAGKSFGFIVLWFLVVGFAGIALWRAAMAARPDGTGKQGTGSRLASGGKALLYVVAAYTTARFTVTGHSSGSTNKASTDFTGDAMRHAGGRLLVGAVGVGFVVAGAVLIVRGVQRKFARNLKLASMSARSRRKVLAVGVAGNVARGVIGAAAGAFLLDAAISFDPHRARGVDGTLRAFAEAPAGPVVLIVMAVGLAAFGFYSFCEARWRRF